mgnify:FL=1
MNNELTDRAFWVNYWENKDGLAVNIPSAYLFHEQLKNLIEKNKVQSAIELGGFPGYYAVFLRKYFKLDVSLLDYFVHPPITKALLESNDLKEEDVHIIETDLFKYVPEKQYDLVLSCGLIEHFHDTADIINRHIAFMKPGGTLFITLPNFKALNGWFQKRYDRENYDKHNIDCMDPVLLANICRKAGLEVLQARYFGNFSLWLENEKEKPLAVRALKKAIWLTGKIFTKMIPFNSKQLSPYIIIEAKKG